MVRVPLLVLYRGIHVCSTCVNNLQVYLLGSESKSVTGATDDSLINSPISTLLAIRLTNYTET